VLVRLIVRDDERQVERALALVEHGAWVSHVVLVETIRVLSVVYAYTSDQVFLATRMLLDHEQVVVEKAQVVRAALEQLEKRPSLRFTDCLVLELARKAGHLPFMTFDRDLAKLEGTERI
jgi:predicted nucleic-acid-binding protein